MRSQSQLLVACIAVALAALIGVFAWVRAEYGPDDYAQPAFLRTWICDNPACRAQFNATPEQEKQMGLDPWSGPSRCPTCGRQSLRRAERCTSCGALIPSPDPDKLLTAKCPVCGKEIFGPLGGRFPDNPHRSKPPVEE